MMKLPFLLRKAFNIKDKVERCENGIANFIVEIIPKRNLWLILWLMFSFLDKDKKDRDEQQ